MGESFMSIGPIGLDRINETTELHAVIRGVRLFFRFPNEMAPTDPIVELFLAAALLDAMKESSAIEFSNGHISLSLYNKLTKIQGLYRCWNRELTEVEIRASCSNNRIARPGVAAFFSGGIDSMYTFLTHKEDITHIVFTNAFDDWNSHDSYKAIIERWKSFAFTHGKSFVFIETNIREFADKRGISWEFMHGPFLCSIAIALGFSRHYIASSHTYLQLFPWGSHPLVDSMWSTETTQIIHDGAEMQRSEKTQYVAQFPGELNSLQVCWKSIEKNCGCCPKCIRTALTLQLLGSRMETFPDNISAEQMRYLYPTDDNAFTFTEDIMRLAMAKGEGRTAKILNRYLWLYRMNKHLCEIAKLLLPGGLTSRYRKFKKTKWEKQRVELSEKPI